MKNFYCVFVILFAFSPTHFVEADKYKTYVKKDDVERANSKVGKVTIKNKVLKLVAPNYFCPYACEAGRNFDGSSVEIARAIYEPLGYSVEYSNLNYDRALQLVRKGEFHATPSTFKAEAPDFFFPKSPSSQAQYCLFGHLNELEVYTQPSDLLKKGKTTGLISGLSYGKEIDFLVKNFPTHFLLMVGDKALEKQNKMVVSKRISGLLEDKNSIEWQINQKILMPMKNLGCTPKTSDLKAFFAISPQLEESESLASLFDSGMSRIEKSRDLERILRKYSMQNDFYIKK